METKNIKSTPIVIITILTMIFYGCKGQKIEPLPCNPWAPTDCVISRTNYISIIELQDFFDNIRYHDSTKLSYDDCTIKLWGWVYYHGLNEPIFEPDYSSTPLQESWSPEAGYIVLVPNENHHGYDQSIRIEWDDSFLKDYPEFYRKFDSYLQKKWYVTIRMECVQNIIGWEPCNQYGFRFHAVSIDTINNKGWFY